MLKRLSRRTFTFLLLPLALQVASCLTRDSTGASSRLRAMTPVVASYGDDFKVYYHWGRASFLDRLTNNHIPNPISPGEETAYGYYSDDLYAEIMQHSDIEKNAAGAGLYVAADPISSIKFVENLDDPKIIEVIIDQSVVGDGTIHSLREYSTQHDTVDWHVIKKNRGVYFREFSAAGLSEEQLIDFKKKLMENYLITLDDIPARSQYNPVRHFLNRVDAILKNPPQQLVRLLPPPEWIYSNDYRVYYHWGDADVLDRLINTHIPNHIFPGEEKAYGYYSDDLYAEIMRSAKVSQNEAGPGIYVSRKPITSIDDVPYGKNPKLIEVIIDKRVVEAGTLQTLGERRGDEWWVIKKNKGIYFREFSGAGLSWAQLIDLTEELMLNNKIKQNPSSTDKLSRAAMYFTNKVDALIQNPPRGKVRMLPPREWVCPQG